MTTRWHTARPCNNCPFNQRGAGRDLRRSLRPGVWRSILHALRNGQHFTCHKTLPDIGSGDKLVCAGSLAWQHARGLTSNYERMVTRLLAIFGQFGT